MSIDCFSPEVHKELNYYVYRLIDPRNGHTFYVGKGCGNRVFDHVKDSLQYEEGEDEFSTKIDKIREIRANGLEVLHIIQRYGMDEHTAFEVEAAIMDCFPELTNIQRGHHCDRGVSTADYIEMQLKKEVFKDLENITYIIIKTSQAKIEEVLQYNPQLKPEDAIYEATRSAWKVGPNRANRCQYAIGVVDGIVKGVYKIKEWKESEDCNGRYEFEKEEDVPKEIYDNFYNKRIPDKYTRKGCANPIRYVGV